MADKSQMHRLLGDVQDDSDVELELPRTTRPGVWRGYSESARSLAKILLSSLLVIGACIASFWAGTRIPKSHVALDKQCAAHTTKWSPFMKYDSVHYHARDFNASFMHEGIYQQPPSPEVDKAWEALGVNYRAGVVSYEDGIAGGLKKTSVQRSPKYGGGFMVNVEGMHHLHCLYKALGHHAFQNDGDILRRHVSHCLDTIRQVLMCNVDTALLGQVWINPQSPIAFPDFETQHVCKNYDDIRKYAEKIQAPPINTLPMD